LTQLSRERHLNALSVLYGLAHLKIINFLRKLIRDFRSILSLKAAAWASVPRSASAALLMNCQFVRAGIAAVFVGGHANRKCQTVAPARLSTL
jgi:hypothetical protein